MKITTLFLFVLIFCLHAETTNSQNIRVTIKQNNTELENVLDAIEKQTDYLFVYNKHVNVDRKVSVDLSERPLEEVLVHLFKETDVNYTVDGSYIILSAKDMANNVVVPQTAQQGRKIKGVVRDASGEPVIGANVVERGTTNGVITDVDGRFSMHTSSGATLQVTYIGYLPKEIKTGNEALLNIVLEEDTQALEEVVVIAYGTQKI